MVPTETTGDTTPWRTRSVQTKAQLKAVTQPPTPNPEPEKEEYEPALQLTVLDGDLPDIDLLMGEAMSDQALMPMGPADGATGLEGSMSRSLPNMRVPLATCALFDRSLVRATRIGEGARRAVDQDGGLDRRPGLRRGGRVWLRVHVCVSRAHLHLSK